MMSCVMKLMACSLCVFSLSMSGCSKKTASEAAVQIGAAAIAALVSKSVEGAPAIEVASAPTGSGVPASVESPEAAPAPDAGSDSSASAELAQAVAASCEPGTELDGYVLEKCEVFSEAPSEVELTFVAHEESDMDAVVAELVAGLMLCHDAGVAQIVMAGVSFRVKVSDHTGADVKEFVVRTCGA